ncbi:MAG: phosphate ABC transporter permease PstA [Solirubrobacteraceae bacterium]
MSPPTGAGNPLVPTAARRLRKDRLARVLLSIGTTLAMVPLVLIVFYLLSKGISSWSGDFFTSDPNGNFLGNPGGIRSAIEGTLVIVGLAALGAVPIGIGVALYLVEYGKQNRLSQAVRFFIDVMTGVPSIVFGLFIYIALVRTGIGGSFQGWKGSVAVGLLMLPIVTRSAEVVVTLVPDSLREAALALGTPRWRVIARIVLPSALPGLLTGTLLAIARAAGETAPLLFTAFGAKVASFNPAGGAINSLPVQIYSDIGSPQQSYNNRAWGAALALVVLILLLTVLARLFSRRAQTP